MTITNVAKKIHWILLEGRGYRAARAHCIGCTGYEFA
jgi:hypothetical protein